MVLIGFCGFTEEYSSYFSSDVLLYSHRFVAGLLHIAAQLIGYFFKHLLSKISSPEGLVECDELDDIARTWLPLSVPQEKTIAIELLHRCEVGITNSHNDDRAG